MSGAILVLNAGSSSIKCALFGAGFTEKLRVEVSGIGEAGRLRVSGLPDTDVAAADNTEALAAVAEALTASGSALPELAMVAHRVVHGGETFTAPARITKTVRDGIESCVPLAPLHNPHHLAAIDWIEQTIPNVPQVACFDTAFHATIPEVANRYALPETEATRGLRRYGFHGNSYGAMVRNWADVTGTALPGRLLAMHLGNGASLCAIRNGKSVATTMGYSPLGGLTMGTRAGVIDPGAVLELAGRIGVSEADALLSKDSGLLGLSGLSADMRALSQSDSDAARFARAHFAYWAARQSGSMMVAMGGCDAIAFTGGIGENDGDIRGRIADQLSWAGDLPVHVIEAQEELYIAQQAADVMKVSA